MSKHRWWRQRPLIPQSHRLVARDRHREMLIIASLTLIASCLLNVSPQGYVHLVTFDQWPLPPTCFTRQIFGFDCPGCGLTRSFVQLAHGNWAAAWSLHRLGWLMFLATALQIPYRALALWRPQQNPLPAWLVVATGYLLIGLLIVNWLAGLILVGVDGN